MVKNKTRFYVEDVFRIFYQILLKFEEVADYGEKDYMWSCFPNEWKITKDNLADKENHISNISLHEFLQWAIHRVSTERDFDDVLNDLTINLFPTLEPATWSRILIFVLSPYDPENRVRSIIEIKRRFGYNLEGIALPHLKKISRRN